MKERADMTQQEITPQMWQTMAERISSVETTLEDFAKQNDAMNTRQKEMLKGIQDIQMFMAKMNGGVRVILVLGSFATAAGGFVAWALSHVSIK